MQCLINNSFICLGQQPLVLRRDSRPLLPGRVGALLGPVTGEGFERGVQWKPDLFLCSVRPQELACHRDHGLLKQLIQGEVREQSGPLQKMRHSVDGILVTYL